MVNHGRSSACGRCKARKVKCDESQPACKKCLRIGKTCPGYPDQWDLSFRDENARAASKAQPKINNYTIFPASQLAICRTVLKDDIQLHSTCLFFRDYTMMACGKCPGWLNYLPDLYHQAPENSLLRHAVSTVAYANIAQKFQRPDISISAMSHYCWSLNIIRNATIDASIATTEATIIAALLLALYECINPTFEHDLSLLHIQGIVALACRGGVVLGEGSGSGVLHMICCQMTRRNLDMNIQPGGNEELLINLLDPSTISNRMTINMHQVSKFIAASCEGSPGNNPAWFLDTFDSLERQYSQWENDASVQAPYENISSKIDIYPGVWTASVWNKHRASRILLHQSLLSYQDRQHIKLDNSTALIWNSQRERSLLVIQKMIEKIFSSAPFCLGDVVDSHGKKESKSVGGYFLVWAHQVILRCPYALQHQRAKARDNLLRIGSQCGVSYARIYARKFDNF